MTRVMLHAAAARLVESGGRDSLVLLLTRYQHAPGTERAGQPFAPTDDARALFLSVDFQTIRYHNVGERDPSVNGPMDAMLASACECYTPGEGEQLMAVAAGTLMDKTRQAKLTGGAQLISATRPCRDCTTEVDEAGDTYRTYDSDVVENEFNSAAGNGMVSSAWGDGLVAEVIDWLLLQRICYDVIPGKGAIP